MGMVTKPDGTMAYVPDTDGGLAAYSKNRYNMDGISYGGMDNIGSTVMRQSPVANTNAQDYLNNFNFSDVNKQTVPDADWAKSADEIKDLGNTTPTQGWGDKFASWFTPQGDKGTSLGGNVMGAIGTGVGAASGLAGMYYAKKNFDLQKEAQDYARGKDAQRDANIAQFAKNAGNSASYVRL